MREPLLLGKLARMREVTERNAERTWNKLVNSFGDHLIEALHADSDPDLGRVDELAACATLLDCCEVLGRDALGETSEIFEESVTPHDAVAGASLDAFIERALEGAPQPGYVYVAWSARPETYWYVGQAQREERVRRHRQHGNLSLALRDASQFTMIFPAPEARLEDLEAAILRVLRHLDQAPKHNGPQLPAAPRAGRRARLDQISQTLAKFSKRFGGPPARR